ncbi:MAG: hypothetical protein HS115_10605 [Spirochaetales bacterium]|nr:hypothetical protein [Spirochaetales bacterium]
MKHIARLAFLSLLLAGCQRIDPEWIHNITRRDGQLYHLFRLAGSDHLMIFCGRSPEGQSEVQPLLPFFRSLGYSTLALESADPDISRFIVHAELLPFRSRALFLGPLCQKGDWSRVERTATVLFGPEGRELPPERPLVVLYADLFFPYLHGRLPGVHLRREPGLPTGEWQAENLEFVRQFLLVHRIAAYRPIKEAFSCCHTRPARMRQGQCLEMKGYEVSGKADRDFCPLALRRAQSWSMSLPANEEACRYEFEGRTLYCKP